MTVESLVQRVEKATTHRRALAYRLETVHGLTADDSVSVAVLMLGRESTPEQTRARFDAWLCHALFDAWGDLAKGDAVLALRGALMAREYLGRIGGCYPSPAIHDAASALQNAIEDAIGGRS